MQHKRETDKAIELNLSLIDQALADTEEARKKKEAEKKAAIELEKFLPTEAQKNLKIKNLDSGFYGIKDPLSYKEMVYDPDLRVQYEKTIKEAQRHVCTFCKSDNCRYCCVWEMH